MRFDDILLYVISFIAIWFGSGLIIQATDTVSSRLRVSKFALSFFVLGMLTSVPEFAVGFTSIAEHNPEIFVGNLLGGIPVIFLLVIPILAVLGKEIRFSNHMDRMDIAFSLFITALPSLFILDKRVTNTEGAFLVGAYGFLFLLIESKNGLLTSSKTKIFNTKSYSLIDLLKLLLGVGIVFVSSRFIVSETIQLSQVLHISPFIISLIILSLGTNLPELSLAIRSVFTGKKDIALGDYLGSAAANTFIFGLLTLVNQGEVITSSRFAVPFLFIATGVILFYYFSSSHRNISRREGIALLLVYGVFLIVQTLQT